MRTVAQGKLRRIGDFAPTEAKEGGTGLADQSHPDPHKPHNQPQPEVEGVRVGIIP